MRMAVDSCNSSIVSSSLVVNSLFPYLEVFVRMVGIPISVRMMTSIPYVIAIGDTPVGLRAVVL